MPLTDIKCKGLEPREKAYKASDEKSLYLEIMPSGSNIGVLNIALLAKKTA